MWRTTLRAVSVPSQAIRFALEDSGKHAPKTRAEDDAQRDGRETLGVQAAEGHRAERITGRDAGQERAEYTEVDRVEALAGHDRADPEHVQDQERRGKRDAEYGRWDALRLEPERERRPVDADRRREGAAQDSRDPRREADRGRVPQLPAGRRDHGHPNADLERLLRERGQDQEPDAQPGQRGNEQAAEPV